MPVVVRVRIRSVVGDSRGFGEPTTLLTAWAPTELIRLRASWTAKTTRMMDGMAGVVV
jgi:hypothetical protein